MQSFLKVSVPFPGILFLNIAMLTRSQKRKFVSVPFPGILFLNEKKTVNVEDNNKEGFRPLPGDLISQSIEELLMEKPSMFPSPSRGSYFSIKGQIF